MSTAFAAAEARLGSSIRARLGNASIILADASVVDGRLQDRGREAAVAMGMSAREIEFTCAQADAGDLAEGDSVTLTYRGTATAYLVAERLPDDVHLQEAAFLLRRAA